MDKDAVKAKLLQDKNAWSIVKANVKTREKLDNVKRKGTPYWVWEADVVIKMIDEDQTLEQIKKKVSKHRLYYGKVKPENKVKAEKVKPVDQKPKEKKISNDKIIEEYEFKQKFVLNLSDPEYIKYLGEPTLVLGKQTDPSDTDWIFNCSTYGETLEELGKKGPSIIDLEAIIDLYTSDLYGMRELDDGEEIKQFYTKKEANDPKQPNMLEINPTPTYIYEDFCNWFHMEDDLEADEAFTVDEENTWTISGTLAPCGGFRTFAPKMVISWGKKTYIPMKNGNLKEDTGEPSKLRFRTLEEFGELKNTDFYYLLEQEVDPEYKLFTKQKHDKFKGKIYNANGVHNSEMGWRGIMNKKVYDKIRKTYLAEQSLYPFNNPTMEGIMDGTNRLGNNKYKDLPKIIEPYYKSNPNNTDVAWLKYIADEDVEEYVNPTLPFKHKTKTIMFHHWLFKLPGTIITYGEYGIEGADLSIMSQSVGTIKKESVDKDILEEEDILEWEPDLRLKTEYDLDKWDIPITADYKNWKKTYNPDLWVGRTETKHGVVIDELNKDWKGGGGMRTNLYFEHFHGNSKSQRADILREVGLINNIYPWFKWEPQVPQEKRNVFNLNAFIKNTMDNNDMLSQEGRFDPKLWEKYGKHFHKPKVDLLFQEDVRQRGKSFYNLNVKIGEERGKISVDDDDQPPYVYDGGLKTVVGRYLNIDTFEYEGVLKTYLPPAVRSHITRTGFGSERSHPYMKYWDHRLPERTSKVLVAELTKINEEQFISDYKTTFNKEGQGGMYPYWFLPKFVLGKPTLKQVISKK